MEHEEWKQEAMEGPGFWKYGGFPSETGGKEWNMRNEGMRQEAVCKRQAQDIGLKRQAGRKQASTSFLVHSPPGPSSPYSTFFTDNHQCTIAIAQLILS